MTKANSFAAQLIDTGAKGYASIAAAALVESRPDVGKRFAPQSTAAWQRHYVNRLLELSAAVAAGTPKVFVERVLWSRRAFEARGFEVDDLSVSLGQLKTTLAQKLPPQAQSDALGCIDEALDALANSAAPDDGAMQSSLDATRFCDRLALRYLQAVLEGNVGPAMELVLDAMDGEIDHRRALFDVLLPAQKEVGRLWHLDQVSIAEEHLVTSTTQRLMAVIADRAPKQPDNGHTAIAAAVAGNVHDVGIRAIALAFELEGWRTLYLGGDVPQADLPAAIQFFSADVALLSCALSVQLKSLRNTIATIRDRSGPDTKIIVGGLAFADAPEVWSDLGADGIATDGPSALDLAEELVA